MSYFLDLIEYFGFELIFIAEYGIIIFFCYIILFIFRNLLYSKIFIVRLCIIMILVIYMRTILPLIQYKLIYIYMLKNYVSISVELFIYCF